MNNYPKAALTPVKKLIKYIINVKNKFSTFNSSILRRQSQTGILCLNNGTGTCF